MALFIHVLADIIHLMKVIVLCDKFFSLPHRKWEHKRLMLVLSGLVIVATSTFIFIYNNDIIESLSYILVIMALVYLLYKEKISRIIIVVTGMIFALSMLDTMTAILFEISMELLHFEGEAITTLVASFISLMLIYVVGRLYRKNATTSLRNIRITSLMGFIILLAIDTFVVTVMAPPNVDLYMDNKRTLYLISIVFVIIGIFIQLAAVILLFTQRNVYKEKEEITDKFLNEQKNHYEYLENREKETKKFRHDLRSHMEMISNLAKNHQYDKIDDYLEKMHFKIESFGQIVTVQNGIVDAIINQYYEKAMQNGVTMEVKGRFPVDCNIDAYDLCTIFSNVLSNSLEAAVETEEKYVSLECGYTDKNIIIVVKNSFNSECQNGGKQWRTHKENADYHGYGLENIKDSVKKYSGVFDIETESNIFILKILFSNMGK